MPIWTTDDELFALARRELFTAVVGDVVDKLGLRHQFLPPGIKPLDDTTVLMGRAMPVLEEDLGFIESEANPQIGLDQPFGLMLDALDDLKPGEVYICAGAFPNYALWGGLMSIRAMKLGAAGAVLNGYSRDTREILQLGFPAFSLGTYAQDQAPRGKVADFRLAIEFGGVTVAPGDVVFGDRDGVLVVPSEVVAEAFGGAFEKVRGEQHVRKALKAGMSGKDAFAKFGIM